MLETSLIARWLAATALMIGAVLLPAVALAAPSFTFVPDPSQPTLPAGIGLMNVADVNGDGVPDLILRDYGAGTIGVMLGDGVGGFGPPSAIFVGGRPDAVEVADFNGDGRPDLLVELETAPTPRPLNPLPEAVEVLSNDGQGGFTVGPQLALHEAGYAIVGDYTGDGHVDAAEVPGCSGTIAGESVADGSTIYMLLGDGHGTLTSGPTTASSTNSCSWLGSDFNGDGRQDLITYSPGFVGDAGKVVLRPGEPSGQFGAPIETAAPADVSFLRAEGWNLDGNPTLDLVAEGFTEPSSLFVLSNDGGGHFSFAGPYPSGSPHLSAMPVVGEFAAPGRSSIVTVGPSISVMETDSKGALAALALLPYAGLAAQSHVADVNKDGRPDLILSYDSTIATETLDILLDQPAVPSIGSARLSSHVWREGTRLARLSRRKAPIGTTLSFSLNVAASVRLTFQQLVRRHGSHGRSQNVVRGSLTFSAHAGLDRIFFDGRLSRTKRLSQGNYRLSMLATDETVASKPVSLSFSIRR